MLGLNNITVTLSHILTHVVTTALALVVVVLVVNHCSQESQRNISYPSSLATSLSHLAPRDLDGVRAHRDDRHSLPADIIYPRISTRIQG